MLPSVIILLAAAYSTFLVVLLVYVVSFIKYSDRPSCLRRCRKRRNSRDPELVQIEFIDCYSQQDDVFTISGRLDQNQQWPTHDGRLSIHHLSMAELNKPPGYNDAPPSYEEAMRMAIDNSIETAREHQHQQQPESSSNQTTTTPATAATTTVTTPASTSVTIEVTGGS